MVIITNLATNSGEGSCHGKSWNWRRAVSLKNAAGEEVSVSCEQQKFYKSAHDKELTLVLKMLKLERKE